jgi:hypothetical protein
MHRSDQPPKIATVKMGMMDESTPEFLQERYWAFISMQNEALMERANVWFDAMYPRYQENIKEKHDHKSFYAHRSNSKQSGHA